MRANGEAVLRLVREAAEAAGIDPRTTEVIARRRLENEIENRSKGLVCDCCGNFEDDEE